MRSKDGADTALCIVWFSEVIAYLVRYEVTLTK